MQLLALNFGSATLKFALVAQDGGSVRAGGNIDLPASAQEAVRHVRSLLSPDLSIEAVAHRVVHGGAQQGAALIDEALEQSIASMLPLAPQHNRLALDGIRAARALWPQVPHIAVFDTSFHARMPERASRYAIPQSWHDAGVRRYGFHGLSHQHVMEAVATHMGTPVSSLRIVSCHLGSGASVCAIERGRSVDTSMGLTPLEGLIMATRCGDLDPGAVGYVARTLGLSLPEIEHTLYGDSGMAALAGQGGDMRSIEAAAASGDTRSEVALDAYAYRVRKYIGAYAAAMGGCDAVAFTAGVGQHSPQLRARVIDGLQFLGLQLDHDKNKAPAIGTAQVAAVQSSASAVAILVVPAREEQMMGRLAWQLLNGRDG